MYANQPRRTAGKGVYRGSGVSQGGRQGRLNAMHKPLGRAAGGRNTKGSLARPRYGYGTGAQHVAANTPKPPNAHGPAWNKNPAAPSTPATPAAAAQPQSASPFSYMTAADGDRLAAMNQQHQTTLAGLRSKLAGVDAVDPGTGLRASQLEQQRLTQDYTRRALQDRYSLAGQGLLYSGHRTQMDYDRTAEQTRAGDEITQRYAGQKSDLERQIQEQEMAHQLSLVDFNREMANQYRYENAAHAEPSVGAATETFGGYSSPGGAPTPVRAPQGPVAPRGFFNMGGRWYFSNGRGGYAYANTPAAHMTQIKAPTGFKGL